jgi:hypothetical protein
VLIIDERQFFGYNSALRGEHMKRFLNLVLSLFVIFSFLAAPVAYAKSKDHPTKGKKSNVEVKNKSENKPYVSPAGWDKGKKKGWKDSNEPPGLEKKKSHKKNKTN